MSKFIIAKKGKVPVGIIIVGILLIVVGIFLMTSEMSERRFGDSDFDLFAKKAAPVLIIMSGAIVIASSMGTAGKTFINVFDDKVEGVGLINGKPQSFVFYSYQNFSLLKQGSQLCVFCNGVGYNIALAAEDTDYILGLYKRK